MNKTDIYKFKACDNISWYQFCLVSVLKFFAKDEIREILLNGVVYVFSADHSAIKKENIPTILEFRLIKTVSIALLSFNWSLASMVNASNFATCISLNKHPRVVRPTFTDLNPDYYNQGLALLSIYG